MAGSGSNFVLDKGYLVLSTYNSSAAAGVTAYRCVTANTTTGVIDLNGTATAATTGIVQENVDAAKVATGKVVANVRVLGISKVRVSDTPGSIVIGSKVAPSGTGANVGGVKLAVSTNIPVGICVGLTGTVAAGDLIDVLLTPGMAAI